jgi:hypothetical protein
MAHLENCPISRMLYDVPRLPMKHQTLELSGQHYRLTRVGALACPRCSPTNPILDVGNPRILEHVSEANPRVRIPSLSNFKLI